SGMNGQASVCRSSTTTQDRWKSTMRHEPACTPSASTLTGCRRSCPPLISPRLPKQKTLKWAFCYGLRPSLVASRIISKHLQSMAHFILCHYEAQRACGDHIRGIGNRRGGGGEKGSGSGP